MKVYKLNREPNYDECNHPSDMIFIMTMLESKGEVLVSVKVIEELYYKFSDEHCCGWRTVTEKSIDEFAEWLDEIEL